MTWLRRFSTAMTIAGTVLAVVGLLGLVLGWGSTSASKASAVVATTTTSTSEPPEDPHTFFGALQAAERSKLLTFLTDRLNPAVIARYGVDQCRQFFANLTSSSLDGLTYVNASGPQTFDYASDGLTTSVPDTYVIHTQGPSGTSDVHFALVNGKFTFFSNCGGRVSGN